MSKTLSVAALENGTVIDHIASEQTWRIIQMLRLLAKHHQVTVGFNLPSQRMQFKDLIKISNYALSAREAGEMSVLAPHTTINIIKDFKVAQKIMPSLPASIGGIFICPNENCITASELSSSFFSVVEERHYVKLVCQYCEQSFERNEVKVRA